MRDFYQHGIHPDIFFSEKSKAWLVSVFQKKKRLKMAKTFLMNMDFPKGLTQSLISYLPPLPLALLMHIY